jgi:hypothetical protein
MSVENEDTAAKRVVRKNERSLMFQIRQKKRKLKHMKMLQ